MKIFMSSFLLAKIAVKVNQNKKKARRCEPSLFTSKFNKLCYEHESNIKM